MKSRATIECEGCNARGVKAAASGAVLSREYACKSLKVELSNVSCDNWRSTSFLSAVAKSHQVGSQRRQWHTLIERLRLNGIRDRERDTCQQFVPPGT